MRRWRAALPRRARSLGRVPGGPAALDAEVCEVTADGERDQDNGQMDEGQVAGLRLEVVGIPGKGARRPREEHEDTHRK